MGVGFVKKRLRKEIIQERDVVFCPVVFCNGLIFSLLLFTCFVCFALGFGFCFWGFALIMID